MVGKANSMENITITETTYPNNVTRTKVVGIMGRVPPNQNPGSKLGTVHLTHDGDGEDLVITQQQYDWLKQAKELTIHAGRLITYYIQIHE